MAASVEEGCAAERINHKTARALLKKERRKKKRQELAKLRDAEGNQELASAEDEDEDGLQYEIERQRQHEEWLVREQKAQEEFQLKVEKQEAARRREEEERKLIEEWRQREIKEKAEEPEQVKKREREEAVQKLLDEAESQLANGSVWHNPETPDGYGTEKDRANCSFYLKTGACRFGERCSRKHCFPSSSQTLLVRGMFITFGMEQCIRDDYDTDASLEYGDEDVYQQFLEFYADVVPEFKNVGKVIQFKVSCNFEPHLRGNVYVQYQTEELCLQAFSQFNGRWYAGRQLQCEFSPVTKWKSAICGLFDRQKCPRGKHCNFLHVFRNPNNEFSEADRDINMSPDRRNQSKRRDWSSRYEDYGVSRRYRSPSPDTRRNGSRRKKHHDKTKKKHPSHRSRSRKRSRSKNKKKHKHKSRSRSSSSSRSRRSKSPSRSRRRKSSSRSKSHSRKSRSRSRSKSHGRKSRSRSRSKSHGRKSRSRSRSRSRSLGRKSRSRSRSRGKKSRSRSRSLGRKSRSRSRSLGRKSRSRSRSRGKKSRSRSRSRGRKSRSRGRKSRSRSRSRGRKSKSRSRSRGRKSRSRSRSRDKRRSKSIERSSQSPGVQK